MKQCDRNLHGNSKKRFRDINRQLARVRDEIALLDERINARKLIVSRTSTSAASTGEHRSNVVEIQPRSTTPGQNVQCLALPDDLLGGALDEDWLREASDIYSDVSNWSELIIPPPPEFRCQPETKGQQTTTPSISRDSCDAIIEKPGRLRKSNAKSVTGVEEVRRRRQHDETPRNRVQPEEISAQKRRVKVSRTFVPPTTEVMQCDQLDVNKEDVAEVVTKPVTKMTEQPLDLKLYASKPESDVVERTRSITEDIDDLCVEGLSVTNAETMQRVRSRIRRQV